MNIQPGQKLLFFDTETSGLPDFNKRASDPTQPHIVQLACELTDHLGSVIESHNVLIRPDGWTIPKETSDIHGITNETAQVGIAESVAASLFMDMVKKANLLVAHNIKFDKFMARIAMRRFGLLSDEQDEWWKALPQFCTMQNTTDLCRLPGKIEGRYKFPKLQEAYFHIFNREFDDAHDALADVNACKEIFFWLKSQPAQILQ